MKLGTIDRNLFIKRCKINKPLKNAERRLSMIETVSIAASTKTL